MKIRIYTDGACSGNPGPGGWASVILFSNGKQEISGHDLDTTNNRMELKAVVESLKLVLSISKGNKIDVYTDSSYIVDAIKKGWLHKWKWNGWKTTKMEDVKHKDLWTTLEKILYKQSNINFVLVKGHAGDKYNEICDKIAKREVAEAKKLILAS